MGKYKKIIILVIIIGIVFAIYSIMKPDPELEPTTTISGPNDTEILSQEIIKAINQIKTLKLDKSIFNDPVLKSLDDKSQEITPVDSGRRNPFAPIPGMSTQEEVQVRGNTNR